jgi:hypothetical protein
MLLTSWSILAQTNFSATLVKNGTYLSIHLSDDHFIPPFEAGGLWKIIKGNEQMKTIREKELTITCNVLTNQTEDVVGNCTILMPFNQFQKNEKLMVFKAQGPVAARLNRYFIDSAYYSIQGNQVYLSAYNTRGLFYFGINEDLIQR